METLEKKEKRTHHGHAIKCFRHSLGLKQEAVGLELGISQQVVSDYEKKPVIDDCMLEKFAQVLKVSPEIIKELEEDPITVIIEDNKNTIENNNGNARIVNYIYESTDNSTHNYNPVEEIYAGIS